MVFIYLMMPGIETRALCMLSKFSVTKQHPQPPSPNFECCRFLGLVTFNSVLSVMLGSNSNLQLLVCHAITGRSNQHSAECCVAKLGCLVVRYICVVFAHLTMILSGLSVAVQSNSHLLWVIENKAVYHSGKLFYSKSRPWFYSQMVLVTNKASISSIAV